MAPFLSPLRLAALVQSAPFQRTILAVILFAGVLAGLETSAAFVERHGAVLRTLNAAVLAVFVVELALRIAAHGRQPWRFFTDGWNCFDFTIVLLCALPLEAQFAAVLRLARAARLLRLVTALPRLQLLVGALFKSLGAMGYVGLLLALLFYVYGVAGAQLFGPHAPDLFGSFGATQLTLFRVITLDNWSDLFGAVQPHAPVAAVLYFVSFILLGTMIMLNLFIGIIMNSMSEMHAELARRQSAVEPVPPAAPALEAQLTAFNRQIDDLKTSAERLRRLAVTPGPN